MKYARRLVALGMVLGLSAETHAQVRVLTPAPIAPVPGVGGYGIGFTFGRKNLAISGFLGRTYYGYPGYFGPGFGFGGYGYNSVTYIYSPPAQVVIPPPIIINNNINVNPPAGGPDDERGARGPNPLDDDRFLKIVPRNRRPVDEGMARKPAPERVRPEAPAAAPKKAEKPAEMPQRKLPVERPADNPKDENARLLGLAREAFAVGEFGRAERRLAQAIRAEPNDVMPYFLLAQAQVALGQFREAVDSINEGTGRKPGWPGERFRPADLYGENKEELAEHQKRVEETLERNPDDFFLLFLRAYQLWFEGKQNDARAIFQRAAQVAPEKYKPLVNRFLLHGMPIVRGD
jgi:hypothetical protein